MDEEKAVKFEIAVERTPDGYFTRVAYPETYSTHELFSACMALVGDCHKLLGMQPEELAEAARDILRVNDEEGDDE